MKKRKEEKEEKLWKKKKQMKRENKSGGVAELANASVDHPRDPGSNLGVDKIFSDSVCISF